MTLSSRRWVWMFVITGFSTTVVYLSPLLFKAIHAAKPLSQTCSHVVAVYAHTDDELTNAALIRTLANKGAIITLLTLTDGAANRESDIALCNTGESITACRAREIRKSAELIGVSRLDFANLPDGELSKHIDEAADAIRDVITESRADCLITMEASGLNGSADHRAAHQAVRQAYQTSKDNPVVFLSTLPWPLRLVLPSELPNGRTDRIHILELNENLFQTKVGVGDAHKSQWKTIQNITLRLGPENLFRWIDYETYSVHRAQEIFNSNTP